MKQLEKYIWLILATPLVLLVWFIDEIVERPMRKELEK
jgi:hypothetical protein